MIYKTEFGFYIDISKIQVISGIDIDYADMMHFCIQCELSNTKFHYEEPIKITNEEHKNYIKDKYTECYKQFETKYQNLINTWLKYKNEI